MSLQSTIDVPRDNPLTGAIFMVFAGIAFACVNTCLQFVTMKLGISSTNAAFWQYGIAALFSIPWLLRVGIANLGTGHLGWHLMRIGLAVIGIQFWTWGLAKVPIWQAIALVMTSPFFVTIGAKLFLRETVSTARWLATFVGFIGGLIILAPWSDAFTLYTLLPLLAALFWSGSSLMMKNLTRFESAEKITVYLLLLMTPINAAFALGSGGIALPVGSAAILLISAGVMTALANWLLTRAYSAADASYVQPFDHLKLPFNILAGWLVFAYVPSGNLWLGAALIIGASVFMVRHENARTTVKSGAK